MRSNDSPLAPLLAAVAVLAVTACGSNDQTLADRQQAVAEAGAEVMPFNLDATTHVFTDTPAGGIQEVIADDPADVANIELIRLHLEDEATKFRVGDFSDPEAIHGSAMPGLATLKERFADISVELFETEVGATITYGSDDATVVEAIHDWFAAQLTDHGGHAQHEDPDPPADGAE